MLHHGLINDISGQYTNKLPEGTCQWAECMICCLAVRGLGAGNKRRQCIDPATSRAGGGGGTDSCLCTYSETRAPHPPFGHEQSVVLPSPNLQSSLVIEAQGQHLQIVTFRLILLIWFDTKLSVFKGF